MGAWGTGSFDNDDASDWIYELEESPDVAVVRRALDIRSAPYLEAPEGSTAIAAAEVVAAARGRPAASLPDSVTAWVAEHGSTVEESDVILAVAALDRVLADDSELRDLWAVTDEDAWRDAVHDLQRRLGTG
jgi:hypothetical protein